MTDQVFLIWHINKNLNDKEKTQQDSCWNQPNFLEERHLSQQPTCRNCSWDYLWILNHNLQDLFLTLFLTQAYLYISSNIWTLLDQQTQAKNTFVFVIIKTL